MIKAIIFDLDGVLVDATEWHYEALNKALNLFGFEITRYEHLVKYNGLPTKKKLEMLTLDKSFPKALHPLVNKLKQKYTMDEIYIKCRPSFEKQLMLASLKRRGFKLAVASNAIRPSVELMLEKSGLIEYFDFIIGNTDVKKPKPDPEIYNVTIGKLRLTPEEVVIVEDAPHGIEAAISSGSKVIKVRGYADVNLGLIDDFIAREGGN